MRRLIICSLCVIGISTTLFAGFERHVYGARASALGGATVASCVDAWALARNPAGPSQLHDREVSVSYSPQAFGLSQLSTSAIAAVQPTQWGTFAVMGRRYGFDLYREISATLGYARTISPLKIGANLTYYSVSIANYGSASTVGVDVGLLVPLVDEIMIGASMKNINAPVIGSSREKLPQVFTAGISYLPTGMITMVVDFEKELGFDLSSRFGVEYKFPEGIALRGGLGDEPSLYSGGIGIEYSVFRIDYAFIGHQLLGATHEFSLTIR